MSNQGVWVKVHPDDAGGGLPPAKIVTPPVSVSGPSVITYSVKDAAGNDMTAYLLPGNTGTARNLALDDDEVNVVAVPQAFATYRVTLGAGTLPGVMVGAGGAGGSAGASFYGGGGGSGAVVGQGANVPVIIQEEATCLITVAPTSPGGSPIGTPVLSTGLSTTIAVEGQEPFQVAIGGGRGWSNYMGSGSHPTATGASGGGGFGSTPYGFNNYGLGTPGLGNDGAPGPIGNYAGGGGGYSSPGNNRDGGNGFDLATALNLSTTDPDTLSLLGLVSVDGFIAGGGTGVNAGTATGGGGQYTGSKNGKDFTGGGGSGHGAATSGSGGAGMVLLVTEV